MSDLKILLIKEESLRKSIYVNNNGGSCAVLEYFLFKFDLLVQQESFKESNYPNGNVRSSSVLKLSLLKFSKNAVLNSKMTLSLDKTKRIENLVRKFVHRTRKLQIIEFSKRQCEIFYRFKVITT